LQHATLIDYMPARDSDYSSKPAVDDAIANSYSMMRITT
jgi:hypothetical protein